MVNPFQVPGTKNGSREPLCPWRHPRHRDYYAAVDRFGEAMANFEQQIEPMGQQESEPFDGGGVVVATGESGCGKTSLLHWCADRVDHLTNRERGGFEPGDFIIDLSQYPYQLEIRRDVGKRITNICHEILFALHRKDVLPWPEEWRRDLLEHGYRWWYDKMAGHARRYSFTLIVILPPLADFVDELNQYCHLARECGKMVFLTESSEDSITDYLEREQARGGEAIWLTVGAIRETDGWLLASDRLRRMDPDIVAQVGEKDLNRTVRDMIKQEGGNSIRRLGSVLYGAWEAHRGESPPGRVTARELRAQLGRPHPTLPFRNRT